MTRLDEDTFMRDVAARVGDDDPSRTRRAVLAVVDALAARLPSADVETFHASLPPAWSASSADGRQKGALANPFADVARRAGLSEPGAHEYVLVVARLLADRLDPETRALLLRHVGPPWPTLLVPPVQESGEPIAPPQRVRPPGEGHTLASGRPGSHTPVSDADAEPAQRASIVRSGEPHAGSKLSSGAPHTDALVSAQEKGRRRLSDADD